MRSEGFTVKELSMSQNVKYIQNSCTTILNGGD